MSTRPQELKKIIDDLRQIIVGKVAMPPDQIEQITLFLFLKQLSKKHDELVRVGSRELIFTGPYERCHFDILIRHSGEELVKECREAVESLYKNPNIDETVRRVFERSYLKILDPKVLSSFLSYLSGKFSDGMDLGDFYEALLPILGTQNELGQFRTPRHIIDFIIKVLDPVIGEKLCDPACGTAGFLVRGFNYLKDKYTDKSGRLSLNPEQVKKLYNDTIFGWDMEPLMVKFSLANLYLHGLKNPNISENDTLLNENLWQHSFDIIAANPPFITPKGGARRHSRFTINSNKTEVLFCEWIAHHLNFNGRMGVIVPEGIIFDSKKGHQAVRKMLLDNGLWCVVSLPAQVFQPYSGVKTSIVFLDKTLKPENILFYEVENHGFSLNTNPTPIDKNDLPATLEVAKKYREALQKNKQTKFDEMQYYTIEKSKILANTICSLSGNLYKEDKIVNTGKIMHVELGELSDVFTDGDWIESKDQSSSGIRLIQTGNIGIGEYLDRFNKARFISKEKFKELNCTEVFSGDILISRLPDPIGRACMIPTLDTRMITAVDCTVVRFKNIIMPKYFIYISKNPLYFAELSKYLTGASRQRISRSNLEKVKIPLPPLTIQDQIVDELDYYQKVVDGAKQVINNYRPSIKIDPKWKIVDLESIASFKRGPFGGSLKKEIFVKDGYKIYEQKHAINDNFEIGKYYIDKKKYQEMIDFAVQPDDLLISCSGTIGKIAMVPEGIKPGIINQALLKLTPDKKKIYPAFLKLLLEHPEIENQYLSTTAGVAIQNIASVGTLKLIKIPLPSIVEQKQIIKQLEEEQKLIEANKKIVEIFELKISDKIKTVWSE